MEKIVAKKTNIYHGTFDCKFIYKSFYSPLLKAFTVVLWVMDNTKYPGLFLEILDS